MRFKGCLFQNLCGKAMAVLLFSPQVGSDSSLLPRGCSTPGFPVLYYLPGEGNGTTVAETILKE